MMRLASVAVATAALTGCGGIPIGVVYGLQAAGAAATIGKDVLDIDVSIHQNTPGKTPISSIVATPAAEALP